MDLRGPRSKHGQSLWLDYIRRHSLESGELGRLVEEDGVRGVTSNPAIFEKAIAGSTDPSLPALDRTGVQGWPPERGLLAAHLRRRA